MIKKLTSYDLVLCGHWHKPYVFSNGKTKVINAGAVSRIDVDSDFSPSVVLLNLKTYKHKIVCLESAKPFDEVVSRSHLKDRKKENKKNMEIEKFIKKLKIEGSNKESTFTMSLEEFLKSEKNNELVEMLKSIINKIKEDKNK